MSRPLFDADYSAIEARIVCWLAGQEDALDEYRQGIDRYKVMASVIYGVPVDEVNKHPQRFIGKQAVLGCGFQQGAAKFRMTCEKFGYKTMPLGLEETAVNAFRQKHPKIKAYWYDVENAAQRAIANRGQIIRVTNKKLGPYKVPVHFLYEETNGLPFLLCKLPSGRKLAYPRPRLVAHPKFEGKLQIKFFGKLGMSVHWGDVDTYGGKLVENCLSGETQVFSNIRGWIRLDSLTRGEAVFDGVTFVGHGGLACKGVQQTIGFHGLKVTPDHLFKTKDGNWKSACTMPSNELYSINEITFLPPSGASPRIDGRRLRESVCAQESAGGRQENQMGMPLRLWKNSGEGGRRTTEKEKHGMWVSVPLYESSHWGSQHHTRHDETPRVLGMAKHERPLQTPNASSVAQLRGTGNFSLPKLARRLYEFLARHGANISLWLRNRQEGQRWKLLQGKLPLDKAKAKHPEQTEHAETCGSTPGLLGRGISPRNQAHHPLLSSESGSDLGANSSHAGKSGELVYDIVNCGPRNQFAVRGVGRQVFIAHNCTQAVAADIMCQGAQNAEDDGFDIMALIHDQALAYTAPGLTAERFVKCLTSMPAWADGLPIEAEGGEVPFYKKD